MLSTTMHSLHARLAQGREVMHGTKGAKRVMSGEGLSSLVMMKMRETGGGQRILWYSLLVQYMHDLTIEQGSLRSTP
jgi:hypothetical protein